MVLTGIFNWNRTGEEWQVEGDVEGVNPHDFFLHDVSKRALQWYSKC
jgi:hypothetical protein